MANILTSELCRLASAHGNGVPPNLIVAIIMQESGGQPAIHSKDGYDSVGLMQLVKRFHPDIDLEDPATNIETGANVLISDFFYLNHIRSGVAQSTPASHYGWGNEEYVKRALCGYNAGAGNVVAWQKRGLTFEGFPNAHYADNIWGLYVKGYC